MRRRTAGFININVFFAVVSHETSYLIFNRCCRTVGGPTGWSLISAFKVVPDIISDWNAAGVKFEDILPPRSYTSRVTMCRWCRCLLECSVMPAQINWSRFKANIRELARVEFQRAWNALNMLGRECTSYVAFTAEKIRLSGFRYSKCCDKVAKQHKSKCPNYLRGPSNLESS